MLVSKATPIWEEWLEDFMKVAAEKNACREVHGVARRRYQNELLGVKRKVQARLDEKLKPLGIRVEDVIETTGM